MLKRLLYLGYYFKQMKWHLLKKFLAYTSKETKRSKTSLMLESIIDVFRYNVSILEYFQFGFYDKNTSKMYLETNYPSLGFDFAKALTINYTGKLPILSYFLQAL